MGDRVLIQMTDEREVSPVLYMHWNGTEALDIIKAAEERNHDAYDMSYAFSFLTREADKYSDNTPSFEVFNWDKNRLLTADDSHGDAGCIVINVKPCPWRIHAGGGYVEDAEGVLPLDEVMLSERRPPEPENPSVEYEAMQRLLKLQLEVSEKMKSLSEGILSAARQISAEKGGQ